MQLLSPLTRLVDQPPIYQVWRGIRIHLAADTQRTSLHDRVFALDHADGRNVFRKGFEGREQFQAVRCESELDKLFPFVYIACPLGSVEHATPAGRPKVDWCHSERWEPRAESRELADWSS